MARRHVSDEQQVFRVVIVARQRRDNPAWERGNIDSPRFLWDGPEYTTAYGPYNTLGAARGQLTFHTVDHNGSVKRGVVSGHIEQAAPDPAARAAGIREAADIVDIDDDCGCDGCTECTLHSIAVDLREHADDIEQGRQR